MRVLNKKYWPYQLSVNTDGKKVATVDDYCNWIKINMPKESCKVLYSGYDACHITFCFKDEHDMFLFKLAQGV